MTPTRREFMAVAGGAAVLPTAAAASGDTLTPEMFGAKGDGRTNDTRAFQALSDYVNARGGGTIVLRERTYIVGSHGRPRNPMDGRKGEFAFPPSPVLQFVGCRSPVIVRGNGATLKAAAGLRFGAFDPATGKPVERALPFADNRYRASPYFAMIEALRCSALVEISEIELDGNVGALEIGGKWGDAGRQIPGSGILLTDNSGPERLSRIHCHHHPLDGLKISGPNERSQSSLISDLVSEDNARQGCSVTGGRNYVFSRCRFVRTGKGPMRSLPKAGVDIEPNKGRKARNLRFIGCEFSDNGGPGLVANKGDSADARFEGCTFVGTANWSAWPRKPGMRFDKCTFVGAIAHAFGDPDAGRAAQFHDCSFRDDPALSPTRQVFSEEPWNRTIALLRRSPIVLFNRCDFALTHACTLPWSNSGVIYSDCRMSQRSPLQSRPHGTYRGTNIISGNVDLGDSVIAGEVVLNGRKLRRSG